ncbi:hypothetical protein RIF29_10121 [Crotalaria pallida]|uniref:Uncharacterized protein n=1 Tax=Crotalaria pallida TaxID=3830 RepID=A0AAN9FUY5_CROPI
MARKKGRPPKTPSYSAKKTPLHHKETDGDDSLSDLAGLDAEDLDDINNLSPKKAALLLRNLDAIRAKLTGKAILIDDTPQNTVNVNESQINKSKSDGSSHSGDTIVAESEQAEEVSNTKDDNPETDKVVNGDLPWTPVKTRNKGTHLNARQLGNFKFLNMCTQSAVFLDVVQNVWQNNCGGYAMYRVTTKLKMLKQDMKEINKKEFSDIDLRERQLRAELDDVQTRLRNSPHDVNIQ